MVVVRMSGRICIKLVFICVHNVPFNKIVARRLPLSRSSFDPITGTSLTEYRTFKMKYIYK